ncbi:MAG: DUF2808 domain-containing protein [Alkalinema sp. RL_2_19]|nr:DUF2808 domain-containing protein [Alkalinema sp. RL_2_19]
MPSKQVSRRPVARPLLQAAVLTGCLAFGAAALRPPSAMAQNGLTIFSGVEKGQELSYSTDYGARPNQTDRYYLKVSKAKMELAVSKFVVTYPDYFDGKFNPDDVEITVNGKSVAIEEVNWDKDNYRLEIYPKEAVPAKTDVELVLSDVTNPDGGMYYLNCLIQAPGDVPILRNLGTWIMSFSR